MGSAASTTVSVQPRNGPEYDKINQRNKELEQEIERLKTGYSGKFDVTGCNANAPEICTGDNDDDHSRCQRGSLVKHGMSLKQVSGSTTDLGVPKSPKSNNKLHRTSCASSHHNDVSIHEAIGKCIDAVDDANSTVVPLPRGGIYVKTSLGAIQFGIPPETLKDSLNMGLSVPRFYVVPHERFNLNLGINVAEMEFPAYYCFFILGKSVNLVVNKDQEADLKLAFKETIEGPSDENLLQDQEYGEFADPEVYAARPDLRKEIDFFCEPRGGRLINCDTLIQWTVFDNSKIARLSTEADDIEIEVHDTPAGYVVFENSVEIACVSHEDACYVPAPENIKGWVTNADDLEEDLVRSRAGSFSALMGEGVCEALNARSAAKEARRNSSDNKTDENAAGENIGAGVVVSYAKNDDELQQTLKEALIGDPSNALRLRMLVDTVPFEPPGFGVTMLGTSHGFDQSGTTTGFIVWIHGYGVAVDPPPHCDTYLMLNGVSPRLITAVILTHCHADHDAGTFQKVLKERRITLLTTPTIYNHFIRKYSAVSGLKSEFLNKLLDYQPVNIAEPFHYHGAVFRFFYSLHALPCIGFKIELGGKSMSYSADTLNDLESLNKLEERGILSPARKRSLLDFPWDCDLVLHECGVPPIHTPPSTLQAQPDHIKEKLFAVHISDAAAAQAGLRKALPGCSNTIVIPVPILRSAVIDSMYLFSATDIFRDAGITECVQVLQMANRKKYPSGTKLKGNVGGVFFIVSEGILQVEREGKPPLIMELGDYFGEISAMNGVKEKMKITALTNVETIMLDKYSFNQYLSKCPTAYNRLKALEGMRSQGFSGVLRLNSVFRHLTFQQRIQLQSLEVTTRKTSPGEVLFDTSSIANSFVILSQGTFTVVGAMSPERDQMIETKSSIVGRQNCDNGRSSASFGEVSLARIGKQGSARDSFSSFAGLSKNVTQGCVFIPINVFNQVVMGATTPLKSLTSPNIGLQLVSNTDGIVFEISAESFADFLERNPGVQLALMKHTSGVVI